MAVIDKKVGEFSIKKALMIGAFKVISEDLLTPVVGNGNVMSGAVKLGIAYGAPKLIKSPFMRDVATAMAIDAVEDMAQVVLGSALSVGTSQKSNLI